MNEPFLLSIVESHELNELMPLIKSYQEFYGILDVGEEQTRAFFAEVITAKELGFMLGARVSGAMAGFATGYITVSGYFASRVVHMGDLFVAPKLRNRGIGRALISAVSSHAARIGISKIRWLTSPTNRDALRLYDGTGAVASDCRLYVLSRP